MAVWLNVSASSLVGGVNESHLQTSGVKTARDLNRLFTTLIPYFVGVFLSLKDSCVCVVICMCF